MHGLLPISPTRDIRQCSWLRRKCVALFARSLRLPQVRNAGKLLDTHANLVTSLEMPSHVTTSTLVQSTHLALR
jgi:hypothetical protein